MAKTFRCKTCGKSPLDGVNAAKGHVRFSAGDHGDRMELPENWRDQIEEIDAADDEGNDDSDRTPSESENGNDDSNESGDRDATDGRSRWSKALTDDVRHLWGGA